MAKKTQAPAVATPAAPAVAGEGVAVAPPAVDLDAIRKSVIGEAHPAANLFPMMSGDEFANLCLSLEQYGFDPANPIKRVKATGKILDGRNREAASRAVNEKVDQWNADPANAASLKTKVVPVYEDVDEGNDADFLQSVMLDNFTRRHLSAGQKAVVIVKSGILAEVYKKKAELGEIGKKVAGNIAQMVAAQYGVNHDYVSKVSKISKTPKIGKALIDAIAAGEKTVMAAWQELNAVPEPPAGEGQLPDSEAVLDGLKRPVGEAFKPIFTVRAKYAAVMKLLREARKGMEEITAGDGGNLLADGNALKEAKQGLSATAKVLRNTEPHAVCPHCDGSGIDPKKGGKHVCPVCAGVTFLSEPQYDGYLKNGVVDESEAAESETPAAKKPSKNGKGKSAEAESVNGTVSEPETAEAPAAGAPAETPAVEEPTPV